MTMSERTLEECKEYFKERKITLTYDSSTGIWTAGMFSHGRFERIEITTGGCCQLQLYNDAIKEIEWKIRLEDYLRKRKSWEIHQAIL